MTKPSSMKSNIVLNKKIMSRLLLTGFLLIALFFSSCEREDNEILTGPGKLNWTGEYAVDGCGFFITIGDHEYKPSNESIIGESFKRNDVNVMLEYQILDRQIEKWCGDSESATIRDGIKIISIEEDFNFYLDKQ